MKKVALKLNREVVRQLTPKEGGEAVGGIYVIYRPGTLSCECTQLCTFN